MQYCVNTLNQPSSKYNAYVYLEEEEEENFQTVSLDDKHWDMEEIPDRHLCINGHSLPHGLCPYPCPYSDYTTLSYYDTLDLSDISKSEDLMTTSNDKNIPALDGYGLWLEMNIYIYMNINFLPFIHNITIKHLHY